MHSVPEVQFRALWALSVREQHRQRVRGAVSAHDVSVHRGARACVVREQQRVRVAVSCALISTSVLCCSRPTRAYASRRKIVLS